MPELKQFNDLRIKTLVTILNGQTDSVVIDIRGTTLLGAFIPTGFDGTTLQIFAVTPGTSTKILIKDLANASQLLATTTAGSYVFFDAVITAGVSEIILVAGSAQTGDSIITLVSSPL